MNSRMEEQMRQQQQYQDNFKSQQSAEKKVKADDYIDYEEVK